MKIFNLFLLAFFTGASVQAQTGVASFSGSRSNSLGGVVTAFEDVNAIFGNQSGLTDIDGIAGIVTGESRFQGVGIKSVGAGVAYPTKTGTFGITVDYFGIKSYKEQQIGLAYAKKLLKNLSVGVRFDYINFKIEGYGNKGFFSGEIGLQTQVTRQIVFGVHLSNPYRIEITENEFLPTVLRAGAKWMASTKTMLFAEAVKDMDYPVSFRGGIEYRFIEQLVLRVGVRTEPVLVNFGVGLQLKEHIGVDIGTAYHQYFGFSPNISVFFR